MSFKSDKNSLLIHVYTELLPDMREVAKTHGYAIAIHGSMMRDFDLIAFPWATSISDPELLITDIMKRIGVEDEISGTLGRVEHRPHNRVSYDIQLGFGAYIDISIYKEKL